MTPVLPISILLLTAMTAYLPMQERYVRFCGLVGQVVAALLCGVIALEGFAGATTLGGWDIWYVDGVGALILLLIALLGMLSAMVSYRYVGIEHARGILSLSDVRLYYLLVPLFTAAMISATLANGLIILWVSLEATTLGTAFLVGIYRKKSSLEAAWKYVLLCSVGTGLALAGIVLTSFAFDGAISQSFLLTELRSVATNGAVNESLLKLSFIFVVVGFGAKMGLVPMHAWLPDAYSKTPSPVSALLSGLLPCVIFLSLLRVKALTDVALGDTGWTEKFFLVFGLLSILLPAAILGLQKNYKRMLSYSTIKHMGILSFAVGLGPLGMVPALMHIPGFAILKSASFFIAGDILLQTKSSDVDSSKGLGKRMPVSAALFLIVTLMLLGIAPSSLFASQFLLIGYGIQNYLLLTLVALAALSIIVVTKIRIVMRMLFDDTGSQITEEKYWTLTHGVVVFEIVLVVLLGIALLTPQGTQYFIELAKPFQLLP